MLPTTGLQALVIGGVTIEYPILGAALIAMGAAVLIGLRLWGRWRPDPATVR